MQDTITRKFILEQAAKAFLQRSGNLGSKGSISQHNKFFSHYKRGAILFGSGGGYYGFKTQDAVNALIMPAYFLGEHEQILKQDIEKVPFGKIKSYIFKGEEPAFCDELLVFPFNYLKKQGVLQDIEKIKTLKQSNQKFVYKKTEKDLFSVGSWCAYMEYQKTDRKPDVKPDWHSKYQIQKQLKRGEIKHEDVEKLSKQAVVKRQNAILQDGKRLENTINDHIYDVPASVLTLDPKDLKKCFECANLKNSKTIQETINAAVNQSSQTRGWEEVRLGENSVYVTVNDNFLSASSKESLITLLAISKEFAKVHGDPSKVRPATRLVQHADFGSFAITSNTKAIGDIKKAAQLEENAQNMLRADAGVA